MVQRSCRQETLNRDPTRRQRHTSLVPMVLEHSILLIWASSMTCLIFPSCFCCWSSSFYLDASLLTLVLWFLMKSFSIVQLLCCKIGCLLMRSSHSLFPGKLVPTTWVLNSFSTNSISVGSHIRFEGPWKYLLNKKVVSKFKFSFGDLFVHSKPL